MSFKEELIQEKAKRDKEMLLKQIKQDEQMVELICCEIADIYKDNFFQGKEIVNVYLSLELVGKIKGFASGEVGSNWINFGSNIPRYLLLTIRYNLAKEYGLIFCEKPSTVLESYYTYVGNHCFNTRMLKLTIKLK